jgi:DNA-binding NtrC family response regulator
MAQPRAESSLRARRPPLPSASDCNLIVETRCNTLVVGSETAVQRALGSLEPYLDASTLVLRHVETLSPAEQQQVLAMLDDETAPRLISTSAQPLYPLVMRGEFLEDLYYRLNVIYVDLDALDTDSQAPDLK